VLHADRDDLNAEKVALTTITNPRGVTGGIAEALHGADVLIGVSGGTIPEAALAGMAAGGAIFALANPNPEVHPSDRRPLRGRWSPPGAATSRTRSTTCSRSPGCSGAHWTPRRPGSPSR
jgi:hypothetical protein